MGDRATTLGREWRFDPFLMLLFVAVGAVSVYLLTTPYYAFSPLPGLVLASLLLLGHNPEFGYYLFLFLIPFEFFLQISQARPEYNVTKFIAAWITVMVLVSLLLRRGRVTRLKSPFWALFAAFLVVNLIAALLSSYTATSFGGIYRILTGMVFFPLTLFFVSRRGYTRTFVSVILWGGLLNYLLFLLEFVFDVKIYWGEGPVFRKDVVKVAYALPGWYSTYFVYLLPLVVHRFFFSDSGLKKAFYVVCFALCVSGVVYLGSRQASVVAAVVLVIIFVRYVRFIRPRLVGFFASFLLVGLSLFLLLTPASYWTHLQTVTDTETDLSISRRISYIKASLGFFRERPLLGSGPLTFKEYFAESPYAVGHALSVSSLDDVERQYRRVAHNTYLEILVGSGLLGLGLFLGIVYLALRNFKRAVGNFLARGDVEKELLTNTYRIAFVANLVFFLFLSDPGAKFFWMFLALSQIGLRLSEAEPEHEPA